MPGNIDELQEDLLKDIGTAQEQTKAYEQGAGVAPRAVQTQRSKAVRMGNLVIGEQELKEANRAIDLAVEKLSNEAGLLDETERAKLSADISRRYNTFKEYMLRRALDLQVEMKGKEIDQRKTEMFYKALAGMGSMGAYAFTSSAGHGGGGGNNAGGFAGEDKFDYGSSLA